MESRFSLSGTMLGVAATMLFGLQVYSQSTGGDAKVTEEPKKLADAGFTVSYGINDVSPGRSAEYWVNESAKEVQTIVWETASGKWAMTYDSDYSMGKTLQKINSKIFQTN